jgi:hypothetical protein
MAQTCYRPDDLVSVADLAERWILSEAAAKRLVQSADVPSVGPAPPESEADWDAIRFRLDAIRHWESHHHIIYVERPKCPRATPVHRSANELRSTRA